MTPPKSRLVRFIQFLGKVKFTTILLLGGAVIMTLGTIVESRESREVAWSMIYGTFWFDVFLFLLGANMVIAVVNRFPIKRHQWPFVLTHFAIVALLAGAWISNTFGYEGRLMVYEGSAENRLYLENSEIRARWQPGGAVAAPGNAAVEAVFPVTANSALAGRVLQREGEGQPGILIAESIEDGVAVTHLAEAAPGGPPGVEFILSSGRDQVQQWLIAGDPRHGRVDLGPVEVEFRLEEPTAAAAADGEANATEAEVLIAAADGGAPLRIALPAQLGQEIAWGSGRVARVREFLRAAQVVDGKLTDVASAPANPAAVVEIRSEHGTETHTVFANYPEFNATHGNDPSQPLVASVSMTTASAAAKPLIAILLGSDGQPYVQVTGGPSRQDPAPLAVGETAALETLGLGLHVQRLLASARPEFHVHPAGGGGDAGSSYIRVETQLDGARQSMWLRYDSRSQAAQFGDGRLEVVFGSATRPLPFSIALDEFSLVKHPGSNRPSEYSSRVQVVPVDSDIEARTAVISMNRPLDVAGFRLFQSSYRLGDNGGPDATVLTVSYDPGVPIVYVSFALIIAGIAWGLRGVKPAREHTTAARDSHRPASQPPMRREPSAKAGAERASQSGVGVVPLLLLLGIVAGLTPALRADAADSEFSVDATRSWAILADGRAKPLQTFANEFALTITGRESFDGLSALEILWGYALDPKTFTQRPYLRIDSRELKIVMGLSDTEKRFSFEVLANNPQLRPLVEQALQRQRQDEKLSRLESATLSAYGKLERMAGLMSGSALTIVPLPDEQGAWRSIQGLAESQDPAVLPIHEGLTRLASAYAARDAAAFDREARALGAALRNANSGTYPSVSRIDRELFYEDANFFGKAWKLYLVGFLLVMVLGFSERPWGYVAGTLLIVAGFVCHTMGIGIRWSIAQRAPVSDMYESLVFMGWGAIAVGLISEAINRKRFLALASGLTGFLCLAFAENLPIDSAINPLVPVLAHTSWLAIHVMTIMLSYSALAVAMVIGHAGLFVAAFQRRKVDLASALSKALYRTLQIGVLFLAAGIIFGAVWANESWGRYWGWDPKETWSLITLFVYLAIIHARFAGWLGHFGLAASAVLGFLAVIMTYYGVNFILAAGLHSYGFSEGGQIYAALYTVIQIGIVVGAYFGYRAAGGPLRADLKMPGGDPQSATNQESQS